MERKTHSYSLAGQKVGKLLVGEEIANLESITSSLDHYQALKGIREIPFSAIVVEDQEGPYILEGGHRFDALRISKARSFPVLVVTDLDSLTDNAKDSETPEARLETSTTRLYRAKPGQTGHQASEWIKEAQDLSGHTEAAERWFTLDPEALKWYQENAVFPSQSFSFIQKEAPLSPRDLCCQKHKLPSLTQLAESEVQSLFACYSRKLCSHEKGFFEL